MFLCQLTCDSRPGVTSSASHPPLETPASLITHEAGLLISDITTSVQMEWSGAIPYISH